MLPHVKYLKKISKVWVDGAAVKSMYTVLPKTQVQFSAYQTSHNCLILHDTCSLCGHLDIFKKMDLGRISYVNESDKPLFSKKQVLSEG